MSEQTPAAKALTELHYLPCIQFFSKLLLYNEVIIEQHENYQKGSYRNRCHLAGPNSLQILSVPLEKGKHQKLAIRQVKIAYTQPWPLQHWRTIQSAYANAPFFPYYAEPIHALYEQAPTHLFAFNCQLLKLLCTQLGIPDKISYTEKYHPEAGQTIDDIRDQISPRQQRAQQDPFFQALPYPQVFMERHGFLPNLSILDLLFCAGPQALQILQSSMIK